MFLKNFHANHFVKNQYASSASEVIEALHRAGFGKRSYGWAAPSNWSVKEVKV